MLDSICKYYGKERREIDGKEYVVTDDYKSLIREKERREYCLKKINEIYPSFGNISIIDYNQISKEIISNNIQSSEVVNLFYNKLLVFLQYFARLYAKTNLYQNLFEEAVEECYCSLLNNLYKHANANNWFKNCHSFTVSQYKIVSNCLEKFEKDNARELYCEVKHLWTGEEEITSLLTKDKLANNYPNSYNLLELLYNKGKLKRVYKEFYEELEEDAIVKSDDELLDQFNINNLHDILMNILTTLTEKEQMIVRYRYGLDDADPKTLKETGKRFGITPHNALFKLEKALRKLRHPFISQQLKDFKID